MIFSLPHYLGNRTLGNARGANMLESIKLHNFGPINSLTGSALGKINLILGENSTGKSYLLKALYSVVRSHEEANRGNNNQDFAEVLSDKLYWTFQTDKIGDIVSKGENKRLEFSLTFTDNSALVLSFGKDTTKKVTPSHNNLTAREANSVFLPPKEVLSLTDVIYKSAVIDRMFGFDATYVDLVNALRIPTQRGRNSNAFASARRRLEDIFSGKVEFDSEANRWIYKKGNKRFSITATAEGIKKIAMLDTLLGNRYLSQDSIVFIDEPEAALHPTAITEFLEIIALLAEAGIQFFIATHSYYVIKKLQLIAHQQQMSIPTFKPNDSGDWQQTCLLNDGLPDNEIINESIRLFEAEFTGIE